jgi:hypothetical protein
MAAKQRLRDKMREDLELRGMSPATIESYVRCVRRFAEYHGEIAVARLEPRARVWKRGRVAGPSAPVPARP